MQILSTTTLPSALLTLLLLTNAPLVSATAERSQCLRDGAEKLAEAAACGDKGSLKNCFQNVPEFINARDLESCFRNAGCTSAESGIEAKYMIKKCDDGQSTAELRRRIPDPMPAPTPAPEDATTTDATTTDAATADATTTAASIITDCSSEKSTDIETCPVQSTGTASGQTLPCFTTTIPTSVCRDGLLCMKDSKGLDTCMQRVDSLDTGATIVTIILALAAASTVGTIVFLCCRDKQRDKRTRARAEAAAIAKANAISGPPAAGGDARGGPPARSASAGMRGDAGHMGGAQGNPFADQGRH
ncbi:hypothetical protein F4778DRAFT_81930 [Xylariomycetidae sp. FL2044]|nr:hypothetical protein F4778DRAFT_81930 [Xylariomycetidae sp. FL2044]